MKAVTKLQIFDDSGEKFFGEGPCRLLRLVEQTGSLRCAAMERGMAYSKAMQLLKQAEAPLGDPLTQRWRKRRRRQHPDPRGAGVASEIRSLPGCLHPGESAALR